MVVDILGKTRIKVGLRAHTALSDGDLTPEQAAIAYREAGYDAVVFTDSWMYGGERELEGLRILSGCEYSIGNMESTGGVYNIIGIGMTSDPAIPEDWKNMIRTSGVKAAEAIKQIKLYNGFAMVAQPSANQNTADQLISLGDLDGIEIYNGEGTYAGKEIDELASLGKIVPLTAADSSGMGRGFVMIEAVDIDSQSIVRALRAGRFYSSQGPEIHLIKAAPDKVKLVCSPSVKIEFFSNLGSAPNREYNGEGLIETEYTRSQGERFVRAEVCDAEGKRAWSNIVTFEDFDD